MLFRAIATEPKYSIPPIWIFDASIDLLQWLADIFQNEQLENAAELGQIGKYYAVVDMVGIDLTKFIAAIYGRSSSSTRREETNSRLSTSWNRLKLWIEDRSV
jgi:hypothetical protein